MIIRFNHYNEAKKDIKDYMLKDTTEVPSAIKSYATMLSDIVEKKFNKWFFRKSLANYSEKIFLDWKDIKDEISTIDFKDFPVEDIAINLKFLVVNSNTLYNDKKDFIEGGTYKQISPNLADFHTKSFKQPSMSAIVPVSYFIRFDYEITIPRDLKSIESDNFIQRLRSLIFHETAHAYDNVKNGKIATARAHVVDAKNMTCLAMSSNAINSLIHLAYISSPEEIYANTIGSYGFHSYEEYQKHWIYSDIKKLKAFTAKGFIDEITEELPKDAEWESNDFGATRFYQLPEEFPKLFADYHDVMHESIVKYNKARQDYNHVKYSDLRKLSLKEFAQFWEDEFNTAGELYESNIKSIINSKKKK